MRFGLRYRDVTRDFDASVVQNFLPGTPGQVSKTVHSNLPSLDATYRLAEDSNAIAQVSRGSLVPSQSFFYSANPTLGNEANPETSTAVQLGLVRQTANYGIGVDVYNINFDNYVSTVVQNGEQFFVNSGGARYRGVEIEGHVKLSAGLTTVANASVLRCNHAAIRMTSPIQLAGDTIPFAPSYTGVFGLVYDQESWGASLLPINSSAQSIRARTAVADGGIYRTHACSYTKRHRNSDGCSIALGTRNLRLTLALNNLWDSACTNR